MKSIHLVSDEALRFISGGSPKDVGPAMRALVQEAHADGLSLAEEISNHMITIDSIPEFVQFIRNFDSTPL